MKEEMVTQMQMRMVNTFPVGPALGKKAHNIHYPWRCLICMKIKALSEGSLKSMFLSYFQSAEEGQSQSTEEKDES